MVVSLATAEQATPAARVPDFSVAALVRGWWCWADDRRGKVGHGTDDRRRIDWTRVDWIRRCWSRCLMKREVRGSLERRGQAACKAILTRSTTAPMAATVRTARMAERVMTRIVKEERFENEDVDVG